MPTPSLGRLSREQLRSRAQPRAPARPARRNRCGERLTPHTARAPGRTEGPRCPGRPSPRTRPRVPRPAPPHSQVAAWARAMASASSGRHRGLIAPGGGRHCAAAALRGRARLRGREGGAAARRGEAGPWPGSAALRERHQGAGDSAAGARAGRAWPAPRRRRPPTAPRWASPAGAEGAWRAGPRADGSGAGGAGIAHCPPWLRGRPGSGLYSRTVPGGAGRASSPLIGPSSAGTGRTAPFYWSAAAPPLGVCVRARKCVPRRPPSAVSRGDGLGAASPRPPSSRRGPA